MQQKLDDLLVEMSSLQQQYVKCDSYISDEMEMNDIAGSKKIGDGEGYRSCVCMKLEAAATPQKAKVASADRLIAFSFYKKKKTTCLLKSMHQSCRISAGQMMLVVIWLIGLVYLS